MSDVFDSSQAENYSFGDTKPPQGFDPDVTGWRDPTPGRHELEVEDFNIRTAKEYRVKDPTTKEYQTVVANQLEPRLICCAEDDPDHGASVIDFIPLPTPGVLLPQRLANQWGQFIKSLGFQVSKESIVPPGFQLSQIKGKRCIGDIAIQLDADKRPKKKDDGTYRVGVKMFGYSSIDSAKDNQTIPTTKPAAGQDSTAASESPATLDL